MADERHWFDKVTVALDNHKRAVQYGAYSVAVLGLAIAVRSVRPFKKFVSPQDFPASFIERQMCLNGRVLRVDPASNGNPTTLIVDHYPVVSFSRSATDGLPVQISSLDLTSNAISWLQHVTVGQDVNFTLLKAHPNCISCVVYQQKRNLGLDLVSLGFASVSAIEFSLAKNPKYIKYYKSLLAAENKAEKKGVGMWAGEPRKYQSVSRFVAKLTRPLRLKIEEIIFKQMGRKLDVKVASTT